MFYQVKQQFSGRPETIIADFDLFDDALAFVKEKLAKDATYKIKATYNIYEDDVLLETWTPEKWLQINEGAEGSSASSGGQSKSVTFNPTPLANAPRPPGVPHSWVKDDEEKDK